MQKFVARVSARNGRMLYQSPGFDTREEAAADAFAAKPNATTCSTSQAFCDPAAKGWRSNGLDIHWHNRHSIEAIPADTAAPAMRAGQAVTLQAGWGFWDVTSHPRGGCFRRAGGDLAVTLETEHGCEWFGRLSTGERICVDKRALKAA